MNFFAFTLFIVLQNQFSKLDKIENTIEKFLQTANILNYIPI